MNNYIKFQISQALNGTLSLALGFTASNLSQLKEWLQVCSLLVGIIGGIVATWSIISHWNKDKKEPLSPVKPRHQQTNRKKI